VPLKIQPFALINRTNKTASQRSWNLHSGPFASLNGSVSFGPNMTMCQGRSAESGRHQRMAGLHRHLLDERAGPDQPQGATSDFRSLGNDLFRADLVYPAQTIAPGTAQHHHPHHRGRQGKRDPRQV
jgi:YidC/Oxa1 family membrane protein insertase